MRYLLIGMVWIGAIALSLTSFPGFTLASIEATVTPTPFLPDFDSEVAVVWEEDLPSQQISPIFTNEVDFWEDKIVKWANEWDLDPDLVATVMQIESCGDPTAVSSAGALGLFQVMPFHFSEEDDPFKPRINAARALEYLSYVLNLANGQADLAFAGYNGGQAVIGWDPDFWPEETQKYYYYASRIYQDAINGLEVSDALSEWYDKWGYSMCLWASEEQLAMKNGVE